MTSYKKLIFSSQSIFHNMDGSPVLLLSSLRTGHHLLHVLEVSGRKGLGMNTSCGELGEYLLFGTFETTEIRLVVYGLVC